MQAYNIDEDDVVETIRKFSREDLVGKQEVVAESMASKYGFPLKVVFLKENDRIVAVTTYPLRKRRKS